MAVVGSNWNKMVGAVVALEATVHYANCTFCKSDVLEKRVSLV